MGRRFGLVLTVHMARWQYNPQGALRWKRDLGEYSDTLRAMGPAVLAQVLSLMPSALHPPSRLSESTVNTLCATGAASLALVLSRERASRLQAG